MSINETNIRKFAIVIALLQTAAVCPAFGATESAAEAFIRKTQVQYLIDDQSDETEIAATEVMVDIGANKIDQVANQVTLNVLEGASGSIPEATIRKARLQVKLDALDDKALAWHLHSLQTKVTSLEALRKPDIPQFVKFYLETNTDQLRWYEWELQKAQATLDYANHEYELIHEGYLNGSIPWATDHQAETALRKAKSNVVGYQFRRDTMEKQVKSLQNQIPEIVGHP